MDPQAIRDAYRAMGSALLRAIGAVPSETVPTAEAIREALSHNDTRSALELALRSVHPTPGDGYWLWVRDVYEDVVIYEYTTPNDGALYRRTYSISDAGEIAFGEPEEVTAQTVYAPVGQVGESASIALTSELVPLIEKAVRADNTVPLKIIAPGWGSSGYYSADVLKRDGPGIFTEGLHMYLNHPTESEAQERPERDVRDLAGRLASNASWQENGAAGPGLYADAEVFSPWRERLDELAPHIGVSIRAGGLVSEGEADGKRGRVVEQLVRADSVDYVTRAGAGGQVVTIMESVRGAGSGTGVVPLVEVVAPVEPVVEETGVVLTEEQLREMRAENADMKAQLARLSGLRLLDEARAVAASQLATVQLPEFAKRRVLEAVTADPAEAEGVLDRAALSAAVEAQVTAWRTDLAESAGGFQIVGMGGGDGGGETKTVEVLESEFDAVLDRLGVPGAKTAAAA